MTISTPMKTIQDILNEVGTDCSGKWMSIPNVETAIRIVLKECIEEIQNWRDADIPFSFDEDAAIKLIQNRFK